MRHRPGRRYFLVLAERLNSVGVVPIELEKRRLK